MFQDGNTFSFTDSFVMAQFRLFPIFYAKSHNKKLNGKFYPKKTLRFVAELMFSTCIIEFCTERRAHMNKSN